MASEYILETKGVTKRFGNVVAVNDVNFKVKRGEIHVLCGENGAGKSTLMKIISGVYPHGDYEGEFYFDGEPCRLKSVSDSEKKGIAIIHQHLALIPYLSIAENIFLGNEQSKGGVIDWHRTRDRAKQLMDRVGLKDHPDTRIKDIGVGKRQLVEICKAISKQARLLILDEPTAALNEEESTKLLDMLGEFQKEGITSILITHKLNEATRVCDTITILRDGCTIESLDKREDDISQERIIKSMVGRDMTHLYPPRESRIGGEVFAIRDWSVYDPIFSDIQVLHHVDISLRKGEVLGIAGLMGAGRTELAMSVFGKSYGRNITGTTSKNGQAVVINNVPQAIAAGLAYVSEDRHEFGLINGMSVKDNITLTSLRHFIRGGTLDIDREIHTANEYKDKLRIKCRDVDQRVDALSGGNQQKVIFSRWVLANTDILILDEPTRGIDVGSKYEIYEIINELVGMGKSVIFISSDMPELIGMCDRVYVLNEGRVVGELAGDEISQVNIMSAIMAE